MTPGSYTFMASSVMGGSGSTCVPLEQGKLKQPSSPIYLYIVLHPHTGLGDTCNGMRQPHSAWGHNALNTVHPPAPHLKTRNLRYAFGKKFGFSAKLCFSACPPRFNSASRLLSLALNLYTPVLTYGPDTRRPSLVKVLFGFSGSRLNYASRLVAASRLLGLIRLVRWGGPRLQPLCVCLCLSSFLPWSATPSVPS